MRSTLAAILLPVFLSYSGGLCAAGADLELGAQGSEGRGALIEPTPGGTDGDGPFDAGRFFCLERREDVLQLTDPPVGSRQANAHLGELSGE